MSTSYTPLPLDTYMGVARQFHFYYSSKIVVEHDWPLYTDVDDQGLLFVMKMDGKCED
jgi:hypothetical protein